MTAAFGFKPYYIRRRLCRWQVCSGEAQKVEGKQAFTIEVTLHRIPWWQFWRGWYGRR